MARHRTSEEWSTILTAYSRRIGSQAEFCREHNIAKSSLEYNLRKSRQDKSGQSERKPRIVELPPQPQAPPVMVPDLKDTELSFHHSTLGGITVRCHHRNLSKVITQLSNSR